MISKIKHIQCRVFEKLLTKYNFNQFNGAQGRILHVLWQDDNIPISELSDKTGFAKTTLTSMLDRLEASGYVQRIFDPNDRRKINIKLTESSNKLKSRYDEVSLRMNEIFYDGFTDDEITNFENCLSRILDNLKKKEAQKFFLE